MNEDHNSDLANLWAAGGQQTDPISRSKTWIVYKYCPECGWRLTGKFSSCPRCGADLKIRFCDYCGRTVPATTVECPHCAGPLK